MTKNKQHHQVKKIGAMEFRKLNSKNAQWCLVNHTTKNNIKKSAAYSISILDRPAGYLCLGCSKEWIQIWLEICPEKDSNLHTQ